MTTVSQPLLRGLALPSGSGSCSILQGRVKLENVEGGDAIDFNCSQHFLAQVLEVIQQFCAKYLQDFSQATVDYILRKVSKLGEGITRQKGVRELIAAVVYCQYSGVIRLKLKDFSMMNKLNQKTFNRKYVAYQNILKREACSNQLESNQVKLEQKIEEDPSQKEEDSVEKPEQNGRETRPIGSIKQAIQLIYDGIFKSYYFQDNRRQLIEKIAERCQEIDPKVYDHITWTHSYALRLYYAIFVHLKQFGMNISFTKYREAVTTFAGFHMKRTYLYATEKIFKTFNKIIQSEKDSHSANSSGESNEVLL